MSEESEIGDCVRVSTWLGETAFTIGKVVKVFTGVRDNKIQVTGYSVRFPNGDIRPVLYSNAKKCEK